MASRSSISEVITALNSRTPGLIFIWIQWESLMNFLLHTHLSKMALLSARTEPSLRWLEQCSTSTRHQESSGLKLLIQHVTSSTVFTSISFWAKHPMSSLLARSQMSATSESLVLGAGSRIPITSQNLNPKLTKASCLAMERIRTPTVSSTSSTTKSLKQWMCDLMKPLLVNLSS